MNDSWTRSKMPSKETLAAWVKALRFFRYYRHYGGHSDVEDEFVVALQPGALTGSKQKTMEALSSAHGQSLSLFKFDDRVLIGITDSKRLSVTPESRQAAISIESIISVYAGAVVDPPIDSPNCYSRKHHPELWGMNA